MGLIKEPIDIDLSTKSKPWSEKELLDFRKLMADIKTNNAKRASKAVKNATPPRTTISTNR